MSQRAGATNARGGERLLATEPLCRAGSQKTAAARATADLSWLRRPVQERGRAQPSMRDLRREVRLAADGLMVAMNKGAPACEEVT
jgi:hypothetical protein